MDNSSLLPESIKQKGLAGFEHIPAKQLSLLLRDENRNYILASGTGTGTEVRDFLRLVCQQSPMIHVLIDVGARVLRNTNQDLAKEWLGLVPEAEAEAALFFNKSHEATMLLRDGSTQPFVRSKYHCNLKNCLVYFDEIHTRGVDIKLPADSRAAVTLGRKLPKDKLLQACMRMRGLGNGQSVVFISTPEVDQDIREVTHEKGELSSINVIQWSIEQTLQAIEGMLKLGIFQGRWFREHQMVEDELLNRLSDSECAIQEKLKLLKNYKDSVVVKASSTLQEMYSGIAPQGHALDVHLEVQTELELEIELEQEFQIQGPRAATGKALVHYLDEDVRDFVRTGKLPTAQTKAFVNAWSLFHTTSAELGIQTMNSRLLATRDFASTLDIGKDDSEERCLRPVQWVLSINKSPADLSSQNFLLLSPFECDKLFDDISASEAVTLHTWIPRTTKKAVSLGDPLRRTAWGSTKSQINISGSLRFELLIFSGQLYLEDMTEYRSFEIFLKGFLQDRRGIDRVAVAGQDRSKEFLRRVLEIRNESVDFSRSHLGRISLGRELTDDDFDGEGIGEEIGQEEDVDLEPSTKKLKR